MLKAKGINRFFLLSIISFFVFSGSAANAYEASNIQLLYSNQFDGDAFIYDTTDGKKTTVTLEHYRSGEYGDIFAFADFMHGEKFNGDQQETYLEISPRLSISKITGGQLGNDFFADVYIASQLNLGKDYDATLVGIGTDLKLPNFNYFSINLYKKRDNFKVHNHQITAAYQTYSWHNWYLEGFIDLTDREINTHNQLLYPIYQQTQALLAGLEWIHYKYDFKGSKSNTNALQLMLRINF